MVGNVGSDALGTQLRNGLKNAGVDTTYVNTVEGASGVALITTGRRGENNIVVVPGANGQFTPRLLEKAETILEHAGFLLAQLEIPLETVDIWPNSPSGTTSRLCSTRRRRASFQRPCFAG